MSSSNNSSSSCSSSRMEELDNVFKHRLPDQHVSQGMIYNSFTTDAVFEKTRNLKMYSSDTLVAGYQKSGTTWLEEMVYLILHDGDVTKCNQVPNYARVPLLEDERSMPLVEGQAHPRIFKTHLPFHLLPAQTHEQQSKIVHIMRNPKDTAVSMYHFYRSVAELGSYKGSWSEFLEMFSQGYVMNGGWFEHVLGWWRERHRHSIFIVKYEDLKSDPLRYARLIAEFLGKELSVETLNSIVKFTSFDNMKRNPMTNFETATSYMDHAISPFMRKGQVGDWKTHFTVAQNETYDRLYQKRTQGTGIEFKFELEPEFNFEETQVS